MLDKIPSRGRAGTIAGLAQWIWHKTTGEDYSIESWGDMVKREMCNFDEELDSMSKA